MAFGLVIAAVSTVMQSAAFVFSRRFVIRFGSPVELVIYSQLWMGIMGLAGFAATIRGTSIPTSREFIATAAVFVIAYNLVFFFFFKAMSLIEASRLSSLTGLKVIVVALLALLFFHERLTPGRACAVLLTAFAAVGMNFSGGRIGWRGAFYLFLSLLGFATTDVTGAHLVKLMPGNSVTHEAICVMSFCYIILGALAGAAFARRKFSRRLFVGALPYAFLWFSAMMLLFAAFGIIGVVFGTIIQAGRGVISVLFGIALARYCGDIEPEVPRRMWVRRSVMSLVMLGAIVLYSLSRP